MECRFRCNDVRHHQAWPYRLDRGLRVVVDAAAAGTFEQGERPVVGVEHHLPACPADGPARTACGSGRTLIESASDRRGSCSETFSKDHARKRPIQFCEGPHSHSSGEWKMLSPPQMNERSLFGHGLVWVYHSWVDRSGEEYVAQAPVCTNDYQAQTQGGILTPYSGAIRSSEVTKVQGREPDSNRNCADQAWCARWYSYLCIVRNRRNSKWLRFSSAPARGTILKTQAITIA